MSPACSSSSRRSPQPSATSRWRPRPRRRITHRRRAAVDALPTTFAASTVVRLARLTVPSPTARRSSTTRFRVWPTSIRLSSVPCARPQRMPRTTASSSSSTAAGVPRSTRNNSSVRRSRSTARKRKRPDGWPPPTRLLTCRGTRSTSGPPMPRRGCPSTAPVRAVPDLRQRALALRTAPRSHRSRLPAHVRRPHARSKDAAVTSSARHRTGVNATPTRKEKT